MAVRLAAGRQFINGCDDQPLVPSPEFQTAITQTDRTISPAPLPHLGISETVGDVFWKTSRPTKG